MTCEKCGHPNPEAARFCIQCANPLTGSHEPAETTGPTVRLSAPSIAPALIPSPEAALIPATTPAAPRRRHEITGAIWLIGLGILFMTGFSIWQGILVLLGLT